MDKILINRKLGILLILMLVGLSVISSGIRAENKPAGVSEMTVNPKNTYENINLKVVKINGNDMVLLRQLSKRRGWTLFFEPDSKIVKVFSGIKNTQFEINQQKYAGQKLDVPPVIKEGKTYISLQSIPLICGELEEKIPNLITEISVADAKLDPGEKLNVVLKAYNVSDKKLVLHFNSGKSYDLFLSKKGKQVWKWSEGRFFTMIINAEEIAPGENLSYEINTELPTDLVQGKYNLTGEFATSEPIKLGNIEININN